MRAGCGLREEQPCSVNEVVASCMRVNLGPHHIVATDMLIEVLMQRLRLAIYSEEASFESVDYLGLHCMRTA